MVDKIDLKPGSDERKGEITEEGGCCPCCGGPCYDNCDLCDREEGIHSVQAEPSCCTGRCCTCFPGSKRVIENLNKEGGTAPTLSAVELEASFYLEDCAYITPLSSPGYVPNAACQGYLGSIILCPSRTVGPAQNASGQEIEALDALCIRKTDPATGSVALQGDQDCRYQICGQKTREGLPEQQSNITHGIPIYEIWCGAGRICYQDQGPVGDEGHYGSESFPAAGCEYDGPNCAQNQGQKDSGTCGAEQDTAAQVPVGQFIEMSVCCCQGNNYDDGDCHRGFPHYNCEQIKKDITGTEDSPAEVDIDQVCSCACYSVEFKFHDPSAYPFIKSETGGDKCYQQEHAFSPLDDCYVGGTMGAGANQPGCPGDTACPMDITDCRCMDAEGEEGPPPSPEHADGWYICAEYVSESILTCACCPGLPDLPGGGAGMIKAGGCTSGFKIRTFITVKDKSSARQNPRVPDKCPSC